MFEYSRKVAQWTEKKLRGMTLVWVQHEPVWANQGAVQDGWAISFFDGAMTFAVSSVEFRMFGDRLVVEPHAKEYLADLGGWRPVKDGVVRGLLADQIVFERMLLRFEKVRRMRQPWNSWVKRVVP